MPYKLITDHPNFIPCNKPPRVRDITGQTFHQLTVIRFAGLVGKAKYWACLCACGNQKIIAAKHFTTGKTQSCGCVHLHNAQTVNRTHGEAGAGQATTEYKIFTGILGRCNNPQEQAYKNYGGRGIQCHFTYSEFLEEVGRRPSDEYEIERIDNNRHYETGNVKWATILEQARNKRNTVFLTVNEERKSLPEWCEITGLNQSALRSRIYRGWCHPCAISVPSKSGEFCPHLPDRYKRRKI